MNVLLTCAGRRNYLVRFFREALGTHGRVLAADAFADAPALQEADEAFVLPFVNDPQYIDRLLAVCAERRVGMLISLNDHELLLISQNQRRFRAIGVFPVVSSPRIIRICFDKWESFKFLAAHDIATARTYVTLDEAKDALEQGEVAFPLVVKPRWGSASLGVERVADPEELELVYALATRRQARARGTQPKDAAVPTVVIQEGLGGQEHGLDVVNDLDGRYVATFARRKLRMRSGETDRAIIVQRQELERLGQGLSAALAHVGNLDCDVFVEGPRCTVIDMNPRFGGGYPFAHVAGANLPAALISWAEGLAPDPKWLSVTRDVTASKTDHLLIVSGRAAGAIAYGQ